MDVFEAVDAEVAALGRDAEGSAMAATARALARELDDPGTSATSKSMCAKALVDVMREIRSLAPPKVEEDEIERARKRRADRQAAARASSSS
jgi:hypothetical protein